MYIIAYDQSSVLYKYTTILNKIKCLQITNCVYAIKCIYV